MGFAERKDIFLIVRFTRKVRIPQGEEALVKAVIACRHHHHSGRQAEIVLFNLFYPKCVCLVLREFDDLRRQQQRRHGTANSILFALAIVC